MSFAGPLHKQRTARPVSSGSTKNRKPKARRKPSWDDTVNDLTVYKATPEEIDRRRAVHRSQNVDVIKEEQLKKKIAHARQRSHLDALSARSRGPAALLREILLDNSQLEETLAKSNTLLSAVKTILSEDHKRIQGLPNVTQAPINVKRAKAGGSGLFAVPSSRLDDLSDSIMDKQALNDDEEFAWYTSGSEDQEESSAIGYQPTMDLTRFQRLIQELDKDNGTLNQDSSVFDAARNIPAEQGLRNKPSKTDPGHLNGEIKEARGGGIAGQDGDKTSSVDKTPSATPRKDPAINDTARVTRTRAVIARGAGKADDVPTMEDFNKVLEGLNSNLCDYEKQMGRAVQPSLPPPTSYTGYTRALLDAVAKMSGYFKENGEQLRKESIIRERLLHEVEHLSGLVDALTADVIAMQAAYARLQNEFVKHRRETEQQLMAFLKALTLHGINVPVVQRLNISNASGHSSGDVGHSGDSHDLRRNNETQQRTLDAVTHFRPDSLSLQQQQQQQPFLIPATLLHPPQQMDSPSVASGRQVRNATRSLDEVREVLQFEVEPQRSSSSLQRQQDRNLVNNHSSDSMPSQPPAPIQRPAEFQSGALHHNSESHRMMQELRYPSEQLQINEGNGRPDIYPVGGNRRPGVYPVEGNGRAGVYQAFRGQPTVEQWNITEQLAIESQLAEVSRQQLEAERKLKGLIERQQQEAKAGMFTRVSPSISPITVELESVTGKASAMQLVRAVGSEEIVSVTERGNAVSQDHSAPPLQNAGPTTRRIKVTMPQTSTVDEATGDSPESVQGNTVKRMPNNYPVQLISKPSRTKVPDTKNGGFFALTSHMSS